MAIKIMIKRVGRTCGSCEKRTDMAGIHVISFGSSGKDVFPAKYEHGSHPETNDMDD